MKFFVILFFLLGSVFAQSKLDTLVFNKINEYRKSLKLKPVEWDNVCYKAATHHSNYLVRKNLSVWPSTFCGHNEDTLKSASDRWTKYSKRKLIGGIGEICQTVPRNIKNVDSNTYYNKMAETILDNWKNSPKHNAIMIDPSYKKFGVSCKYFTKPNGFTNSKMYVFVPTGVFVEELPK
jgi:uncharacterized protein YkwD